MHTNGIFSVGRIRHVLFAVVWLGVSYATGRVGRPTPNSRSIRAQITAASRGRVARSDRAFVVSRSIPGSQNQPWRFGPSHASRVAKMPQGGSPDWPAMAWVKSRRRSAGRAGPRPVSTTRGRASFGRGHPALTQNKRRIRRADRPDQARLYSMTTASAYSGSVTTNTLTNANCFISPSVSRCAVEQCRPPSTTTTQSRCRS